ncbi:MAG TPA: arylsulfatase [Opitutus sp.]|nr:arylsulfatase [Opitutus sp.]
MTLSFASGISFFCRALLSRRGWANLLRGAAWGVVLPLAGFVSAARAAVAATPNVVVIVADDLGLGDVSCYNPQSAWRTPAIDRLAREGRMFTDAHTASSLCTPSRYALLTGRYAWRGRLKHGVLDGYGADLIEPGRLTLPGLLRQHGYTTAAIGKWHLGLDWIRNGAAPDAVDYTQPFGGGPLAHGFNRFFGISASLDMPPYVWLRDDRVVTPPTGRVTDSDVPKLWRAGPIASDFKMEDVQPRLTQAAVDYIGERATAPDRRPFFLYLAFAAPHTPILPQPSFAGSTGTTDYGDFVAQVDADIGRVMAALEQHGLSDQTVVVFTSDNGFAPAASVPAHRQIGHDPSAGFRGYKSDLFDGGHRVPLIVRWPEHVPANTRCAEPVGLVDWLATCADVAGVELPVDAGEDSVSFAPLLRGADVAASPRALVHHSGEGRFAIRQGKWKLLLWPGSGGWSSPTPVPSRWLKVEAYDLSQLPPYQLYDLSVDSDEQHNVAAAHPEVVQRLGRLLADYVARGRSTPGPSRPAVVDAAWPEAAWMKEFGN